ncbi:restriction endonuclease [Acidihalobacter ferrooxydans]|uniref:restriction endonuclease n=1 Tax=Acidihalobacter ferrooxydans TaxID=1765967 RepID=UPI0018DB3EF1|nr:restriction endonuclease [Acidihalobacter ferrooxydans]
MFRRKGYSVAETGGNGPDGGVDLVLKRDGETFFVQCKQWRAYKVGVGVVRELYGVMSAKGATGGFVVTSGEFTRDAIAFADGRNIELIAGDRLSALIVAAKSARATPAAPQSAAVKVSPVPKVMEPEKASPACPRCGGPMVRRVARQGANAGRSFWGCADFPKCRGIVPIDR